ncbi:histidine--tRNA ligase [Candidatus Saccharibacteria bacterium]|nr:histidine--tRNA ligase [Candidatus Saccharibacteria bacterium]
MKKFNTTKVSGTQELLPDSQALFNQLKTIIESTYKKHGFLSIETPHLERTEILLAKAGGETEKQIYKVVKTAETIDESDQALRFDHTVSLARYIVEHENDLTFPFKVSNIGINFRGERAQKGRFREFYQCDIDVIGRNTLPIAYDADVISTLLDTLKTFELNTPIVARISNRKILSGLIESLNLTEKSKDIYSIIDHCEKVPPEKTEANFKKIGLSEANVKTLLEFINLADEKSTVINYLNSLNIQNETFNSGVSELDEVLSLLESQNLKSQISADLKIVRGLDYYTGTVFEFILPEFKNIGSICGGGRYENLTKYFSDQPFPGVGGSIGLTRLFYVLNENDLLKNQVDSLLDFAIIPITKNEYAYSANLAKEFQQKNYKTTVVYSDKKLSDKITYASKIAKNGIVVGEDEINTKNLKAKNFETGETSEINL